MFARPTRFRFLLALLGTLALAGRTEAAAPADGEVHIVRTFFGWRDAASFKRISEYFSGRENTGGEIILRTHPDQRSGYYFLVRVANEGAPVAARVVLQVVAPGSTEPRTFTFKTSLANRESVLDLGLTGADWPDRKVNAVAWRIDVFDDAEKNLATAKSYLWERPADK